VAPGIFPLTASKRVGIHSNLSTFPAKTAGNALYFKGIESLDEYFVKVNKFKPELYV
jgi:hypothetical protein